MSRFVHGYRRMSPPRVLIDLLANFVGAYSGLSAKGASKSAERAVPTLRRKIKATNFFQPEGADSRRNNERSFV